MPCMAGKTFGDLVSGKDSVTTLATVSSWQIAGQSHIRKEAGALEAHGWHMPWARLTKPQTAAVHHHGMHNTQFNLWKAG